MAETYAEVSPSGEGLRLFVEGKVEKTIKLDPAGIEIYGQQRHLAVTDLPRRTAAARALLP